MSTGSLPIVMCDFEDGCTEYTEDHYAMCVDSIDGVKVTPIPAGWGTRPGADHLCPDHAATPAPEPIEPLKPWDSVYSPGRIKARAEADS